MTDPDHRILPAGAKTLTTYKRTDGELIADEWDWTTDIELCETEADEATEPIEFVEEVWTLTSTRTFTVNPYGWLDKQDADEPN